MDNVNGLREDTLRIMEWIVNPCQENKHEVINACRELFSHFDRKINQEYNKPIHETVERPGGAQYINVAWPKFKGE